MSESDKSNNADQLSAKMEIGDWRRKAEENVEEWGLQDVETLLLAMQEEMGELAQAHLEAEHEDGDPTRIARELADLGALCVQLRWRLEQL
jgi:NTP pyrophosphatase (non-canonical NTP hydrolase)